MSTRFCAAALLVVIGTLSTCPVSAVAQSSLSPALHWDHDPTDLQHLLTVDKIDYTTQLMASLVFLKLLDLILHRMLTSIHSDPTLEHAFAHVSNNLNHPDVILGHSSYVDAVQCTGQNLRIAFKDEEGYEYARNAWANETDFILSTYSDGCGTLINQRTFWLVDHLTFGSECDTCVIATIQREIDTKDALLDVDATWGTYRPTNVSTKAKRAANSEDQVIFTSNFTGSCGPAPSDKIGGLPSATCNLSKFDQELDDKLGYLPFDTTNYSENLRTFAPGLGDFTATDNKGFESLHRRNINLKRTALEFFKRVGEVSDLIGLLFEALYSKRP